MAQALLGGRGGSELPPHGEDNRAEITSTRMFPNTRQGSRCRMRDPAAVKAALKQQRIELPSWAFGNTGTRFKVFAQPGVPRTPFEKVDDAATVHRFTGVAPTVALHIPWDAVDDYGQLAKHAADQ